jgi:hypothetical protein
LTTSNGNDFGSFLALDRDDALDDALDNALALDDNDDGNDNDGVGDFVSPVELFLCFFSFTGLFFFP